MDTKERKRRTAEPKRRTRTSAPQSEPRRRRTTAKAPAPAKAPAKPQRRRTAAKAAPAPDRAERKRRATKLRQSPKPQQQRVIRAPKEEIPSVVYTPPKPLRRGRFAWKLVSMAAVVLAVFLGLSVFFRVETVEVAGAEKYTPWMVMEASGIAEGDALLGISEARVASRIQMNLPYVDKIKVHRTLPGTVTIEITELQVTYAIEDENGNWWLISAGGRAVEQVDAAKASGYTRIRGLAVKTPQPDQTVQAMAGRIIDPGDGTAVPQEQSDADAQLAALIQIMTGLESSRVIGEISVIDVTDVSDLRLEYPHLLTVRLGDTGRLDYKISYMAAAVAQLAQNQSGELDLTLEYTEDAVFTPAG